MTVLLIDNQAILTTGDINSDNSSELYEINDKGFPYTVNDIGSSYTWINQDNALLENFEGRSYLYRYTNSTNSSVNMLIKNATAPYTFTVGFIYTPSNEGEAEAFVIARESSSGKFASIKISDAGGSTPTIVVQKWNSPSSFSANYTNYDFESRIMKRNLFFFRIQDTGTNRISSWSCDGHLFIELHSVSNTDFCTADQVGIGIKNSIYDDSNNLCSMAIFYNNLE